MAKSKFCNIDDFEVVDTMSIGQGVAVGADPFTMAGFSIFMEGQAGTPAQNDDKDAAAKAKQDEDEALETSAFPGFSPVKKSQQSVRNIMEMPSPKPPTWWIE